MTTPKKTGRPSSFRPEYNEQARKLCLLGLTDKQMADIFDVSESTFNNWKKDNPEFLESIKKGKELADADVAASLYERAKGYEHDDVHFSSYEGIVTATPYRKYYPPDTAAAFIWLKNRQPKVWRDKPEGGETGEGLTKILSDLIEKLPG
jgi:transcriptional regulator with XRE-family HTH domain